MNNSNTPTVINFKTPEQIVRRMGNSVITGKPMLEPIKPEWMDLPEAERRKMFNGFLYPDTHPFAIFEGNFRGSIAWTHTKKIMTEIDEKVEDMKQRHKVPMANKRGVVIVKKAIGVLKKAA